MNLDALLPIIVGSITEAAISGRSVYAGINPGSQQPEWHHEEGPLMHPLREFCGALLKDPAFAELLHEEMKKPDNVALVATKIVERLAENAVRRERKAYGGGEEIVVDETMAAVIQEVLAEQLRARPELLGDRVDAEMVSRMHIEVKITPPK